MMQNGRKRFERIFDSQEEMQLTAAEQSEEAAHAASIICNMRQYEYYAMLEWHKLYNDFESIREEEQCHVMHSPSENLFTYLATYEKKLNAMVLAIHANQLFLHQLTHAVYDKVAEEGKQASEGGNRDDNVDNTDEGLVDIRKTCGHHHKGVSLDVDHVRSTLRQFVRDWAREGERERQSSYGPLLEALDKYYGHLSEDERAHIRVLNPGAGLGRLPYEIIKRGFSCQGNEFSLYMLFGSHLMLNDATEMESFVLYPYALQTSNCMDWEDAIRPILVPDDVPILLERRPAVEFSMVAGDFLRVYANQRESWDVVVTSFFMDTANHVIEYLRLIYRLLRPGGRWMNLGPLLYHFTGMEQERSIELSYKEIRGVMVDIGFIIEDEKRVLTTYAANRLSMMTTHYLCIFFVALKPLS